MNLFSQGFPFLVPSGQIHAILRISIYFEQFWSTFLEFVISCSIFLPLLGLFIYRNVEGWKIHIKGLYFASSNLAKQNEILYFIWERHPTCASRTLWWFIRTNTLSVFDKCSTKSKLSLSTSFLISNEIFHANNS